MRVIWKDSMTRSCPPMLYRNVTITRYEKDEIKGWTINLPGDNNIYATQDNARNAVNKAFGGKPRKDGSRLALAGIRIVGTYDKGQE